MPLLRAPQPHKITLIVALVWLVFALAFGLHAWQASREDLVRQLRTVAELAEKSTDRYFEQLQAALSELAEEVVERDRLGELADVQRQLVRFKDRHPELIAASLLDTRGQFLATSTTTRLVGLPSVADQRDFAATLAALRHDVPMELTRPLFGPASGRWILPIRYTVRAPDGTVLGFLVASAPVEMLHAFWSQAPAMAKATIALVRDDGHVINRFPVPAGLAPEKLYGQPRSGDIFQQLREAGFPPHGYLEGTSTLTGRAIGTVFVRLEHYPVTLLASLPRDEFVAAWWDRSGTALLLAALLAAFTVWAMRRQQSAQWQWSIERLRIERELRASQEFLERAGEVAGVGGWSLDLADNRLTWSAYTRRIHEVDEDYQPTVDKAIGFYEDAEARDQIAAALDSGIRDGLPWDLELPLTTAKGRQLWVRAQGRAERVGGQTVRLVGAFQDVTNYRQRRIALQQESALREQAERHAQELARLLAERVQMIDVLAHEVRQPLNNASAALQGASAALRSDTSASAAYGLDRAQVVLSDVLARIDNTLAVAELVASPRRLHREDCDIDFVIGLALQDLPAGMAERVVVERDTPTRTAAMDPGLVRLALRNMLANALRYSPAGSRVTLRVADLDQPLALVLEVADQGPGFEGDLLPNLFERGRRGQQGAAHRGHGLGLYIVKRVADLHQGSVEASNRAGGGAVVRLILAQDSGG